MKKTNDGVLYWIFKRIKRFIPAIALTSAINVIIALSYIWLASLSRNVIDRTGGGSLTKVSISVLMLLGLVLLQITLNALLSLINIRISGRLTISMRNYMFSSIVHKKYAGVFDHHTGDLLNRFTSDVDQVVSGTVNIIPGICSMAAKIIAGLWALIIQNYILAVIIAVVGFIFPLAGRTISKRYKYMHKEVQRTEGEARSFLQESFANIVVIKTFISEQPILRKLNEYMQANLKTKIKRNFISVCTSACLHSFFNLGYYIILAWGAGEIAAGNITYGTLTYYLQLVSILRTPLQNISGVIPQYYAMTASAERLKELDNIESEQEAACGKELEALKQSFNGISVRDVYFAYKDEPILTGCSFDIECGGITAITGESGSGKSTLFKLFLGLYEPDSGTITLSDGTPVGQKTRGLFAYVPQGNMILSGTIRDNITLYNSAITEEQITAATKAAVIYDFISSLPDGLDTKLSERGAGLSEGQIQRISIARALLFDVPILLLDESTSALDEATETQLLSNIKQMTEKTVLFITHRNTSISVCDRIIHVKDKHFKRIK